MGGKSGEQKTQGLQLLLLGRAVAVGRADEQVSRHGGQPGDKGEDALERTRQVVTASQLNGELRHQAGRELGGAILVFEPGGEQGNRRLVPPLLRVHVPTCPPSTPLQTPYLTLREANQHCADGAGVWQLASSSPPGEQPDIVLACAGDGPTQEALAAVALLHEHVPDLRARAGDLDQSTPPYLARTAGLTVEQFEDRSTTPAICSP
jgi:hypothetical protein